jgi:hypothetical protein
MLDIETMGISSNAAIVAIGAVAFDEEGLGPELDITVDLHSAMRAGLKVDASTIYWWLKQSEEARESLQRSSKTISAALHSLAQFIEVNCNKDTVSVFGNGVDFDNIILTNAYNACDIKLPWSYRGNRCYRTLKNTYPEVEFKPVYTQHVAVCDARNQALHMIEILKEIKKNGTEV